MKMKKLKAEPEADTIPEGGDFFFWLGNDGFVEELLNEAHLNEKIDQHRKTHKDWLNARTQIEY